MSRLKGKLSENLTPEQKIKAEKTIERMQGVRQSDYVNLRDKIEKRLEEIKEEKQKVFITLENIKKQENEISKYILKLQGAEIELQKLLE